MARRKKKSNKLISGGTFTAALAGIVGLGLLEKHMGSTIPFLPTGRRNVAPPPNAEQAANPTQVKRGYGLW